MQKQPISLDLGNLGYKQRDDRLSKNARYSLTPLGKQSFNSLDEGTIEWRICATLDEDGGALTINEICKRERLGYNHAHRALEGREGLINFGLVKRESGYMQ